MKLKFADASLTEQSQAMDFNKNMDKKARTTE